MRALIAVVFAAGALIVVENCPVVHGFHVGGCDPWAGPQVTETWAGVQFCKMLTPSEAAQP